MILFNSKSSQHFFLNHWQIPDSSLAIYFIQYLQHSFELDRFIYLFVFICSHCDLILSPQTRNTINICDRDTNKGMDSGFWCLPVLPENIPIKERNLPGQRNPKLWAYQFLNYQTARRDLPTFRRTTYYPKRQFLLDHSNVILVLFSIGQPGLQTTATTQPPS